MKKSRRKVKPALVTHEEREQIAGDLQETLDRFKAEFVGVAPDWGPLEKVLPREWWGAWMFMQRDGDVRCYKHGITRRYLYIDSNGQCYAPRGKWWRPIPAEKAIEHAYAVLEELGWSRSTKYDDAFRAEKYARWEAAGFKVIR